jgi:hypothetical protein
MLYLKLGVQCCRNFRLPETVKLNVYSSAGVFSNCQLDPAELGRLHRAALNANQSGELARNNYSLVRGKIVIMTPNIRDHNRYKKAYSTPEFIRMIHNNDH